MITKLKEEFRRIFNSDGNLYFAPGRVNLIGEHTDYNGGHVFPSALTIGTYAVARKREDKLIRLYSMNFPENGVVECNLDIIRYDKNDDWANYPKGIFWTIINRGIKIDSGIDILFYGNIPNGAGLSSSASIEVLTGYVISKIFNLDISNIDLALIGQEGENKFNGMNCGIMDQFAIAMGKENSAIFLNTSTLEYEYAPIELNGYKILIMNTNKKRKLEDSKYNERRSECEQAVNYLNNVTKINSLCQLSIDEFEEIKESIKDDVIMKRAKHAVYENERTIEAVLALNNGNLKKLGELMKDSHISLKEDYEVSGIELDTLVEAANSIDGVIGARMTGAGFGGCAVSIVKNEVIDIVINNVGKAYKDKIGYDADFYIVEIGNGPCEYN